MLKIALLAWHKQSLQRVEGQFLLDKGAAFHRLRDFLLSARHVKDHDDFNSTRLHIVQG